MIPTRRFALVALVVSAILLAFPGDLNGSLLLALLGVNAILLLIGFADSRLAVDPRGLTVRRHHVPVATLETSVGVNWEILNPTNKSARVRIADSLVDSLRVAHPEVSLRVPPLGRAVATSELWPSRRGRFALTDMVVRSTGPLGLMSRQKRVEVASVLRVHPPFRSKAEAELRVRQARRNDGGLRLSRGKGGGTEFEQLREYSPDDEFRRIDWAASARLGHTIVRTYRPEINQNVVIMLDNGRVMAPQVAGVPRVELAMDAVMMLTAVATGVGDKVGMVAFDTEERAILAPSHHANQVGRVTEAMFALEPVLSESDYHAGFQFTLSRFRRRSLMVLLTELAPGAIEESIMPSLSLILRRHVVMLGTVRDPQIVQWASEPADSPEGLYRRSAALQVIADRERLIAKLRGMGATVIDAPPGKLSSQLADAYLAMKSSGAL